MMSPETTKGPVIPAFSTVLPAFLKKNTVSTVLKMKVSLKPKTLETLKFFPEKKRSNPTRSREPPRSSQEALKT